MHNAWVTSSGEKMSKSLGNGTLVREVVERYPAMGVRYYLAQPHYRSHIEFSFEALAEAVTAFERIQGFLQRATERVGAVEAAIDLPADFEAAMDDDLATPAAMGVVHRAVHTGNAQLAEGNDAGLAGTASTVRAMLAIFGLDPAADNWSRAKGADAGLSQVVDGLVSALLDQRTSARARRDYEAADAIRDQLAELGVRVEDTAGGSRWTLESPTRQGA
jgi:cysteinyl-tRNA synthetase